MKRLRFLSLIILVVSTICGCQSQTQSFHEIKLIPVDTISFLVDYDQYYSPWGAKYITEHDSAFILLYDPYTFSIRKYHYPTGEMTRRIPFQIPGNGRNEIWSYFYQNRDSIYVLMDASNFQNDWHDSSLVRINDEGKVQEIISLVNTPLSSSQNPDIASEEKYILWDFKLDFQYPYIHFSLRRETQFTGVADTAYSPHDPLIGGAIDIRDKAYPFTPHLIDWPDMRGNVFPVGSNQPQLALTPDGKVITGKKYLPDVYIVDVSTQQQEVYLAPSVVADTVHPLAVSLPVDLSTIPASDPSQIRYQGLTYHPWWDCYIRFMQYPLKNLQVASAAASAKRGLIFLDREFRIIGECLLPDHYGGLVPLPEGLGMWNLRQTGDMIDSFELVVFDYGRFQTDPADYISRAVPEPSKKKSGGWTSYLWSLSTFELPNEPNVVMFIPVDRGCQGCLDYMIDLFMEEAHSLNEEGKTPIKAILASKNPTILRQKLEGHGLNMDTPGLYIDLEGRYQEYVSHSFRQGQLLFCEKGKVVSEVGVNPAQLTQLKNHIYNYLQAEE